MSDVITLNEDCVFIKYLCEADQRFKKVFSMVGPISYKPYEDSYSFLVSQIISQMLSKKVARTLYNRLEYLCNGKIDPMIISRISNDEIRSTGISKMKINYIRSLTKAVTQKELVFTELLNLSDDEVVNRLVSIKGIGSWTAKMYLIFVLNRLDILPYEDGAFLKAYGWVYGTKDYSKSSIEKRCKCWKPYSSIAVRYMYRVINLGLTKQEFCPE